MFNLDRKDWIFCLRWTLATAIAIGICSLFGLYGLLVGPFVVAIAQGLALVGYWNYAILWGLAIVIGGYTALVAFLGLFVYSPLPLPITVMISGAVMGLAEGFVLRPVTRLWKGWPLLKSLVLLISIGWFVPSVINASVSGVTRSWWEWLALATLTGLIGGALKGLALVWFLKQAGHFKK